MTQWQPAASLAVIRQRAQLYARIRAFFAARGVLEVDTPVLSQAAVSDPHLAPMSTSFEGPGVAQPRPLFLQTSPEYPMKRLLAAGSGPIYQLAKAFRNGEAGGRHNPEFCMLEWYRPGFDEHQLMDEVADLVGEVLARDDFVRLSYRQAFERFVGLDPHEASLATLQGCARERLDLELESDNRDTWLNLLLSHLVEPELRAPTFIFDFPASQAALARVHPDERGTRVARRFELYTDGVELANGYFELTDSAEQTRRFNADQQQRRALGVSPLPLDEHLLAALAAGLPECAGVALGVDRLLMLASGCERIEQVLAFPFDRA
ncbi:EF-P lysine aminoacylase EpmA [Motiliproteus sp. SC1-56]|uniref:EF-P lysine aminoacylase EpmA n=1 Tax=Motiliproteus sp. SC1-56 TaxID=2799565 RepID=UPI001A90B28B|nr:EF-P lysine aminoacylase EpmA [Motiliproteus sp. SC1-56]